MTGTLDPQKQKRIADNLKSALVDFFVGANNGTVSHTQRAALTTAWKNADVLPDDVMSEAVNAARREAQPPPP